jgi:hypothetical protein
MELFMTKIYHRGIPCHPPVVNGITFEQDPEHECYYSAEASVEELAAFEGVTPFFTDIEKEIARLDALTPDVPPSSDSDMKAMLEVLSSENVSLAEAVNAKDKEIADLNATIAAMEAAVGEAEAVEGVDAIKAEIETLEAKKAVDGKLSPAESMKLGKLKKRIAAAN